MVKNNKMFLNGRLMELNSKNYSPMNMTESSPNENKNYSQKAVININEKTLLSELFFSEQNINNIQNSIRYKIYKLTGQTISRQSDTDLKIIMRSYYLQYGKNDPNYIKEQITDLNNHVLNYCVPKVHDELLQHKDYIKDVQSLYMPISRPINMSSAGTKVNKSVTDTF